VRVHPENWGRGIGTALLRWGEARARERIVEAPEGARVTIGAGTISTNETAHDLLQAEGWQMIRHFFDMHIEFGSPPPAPQWPTGIVVRTLRPGQDEEAVFRAIEEAFRDHWGYVEAPFEERFQRFMHFLNNHPDYDPSLCFMAMAGDEVAGVALCMPKTTEYPDMAWVEDLGVRRPWRKQGVGLALLHHSFGEFYWRGIRKAGLGVDGSNLTGALRLYHRAGMHQAVQFDGYEKELRAGKDLATQSITN
jgi:GNAT superfamily N-acetyltransferase